MASAPELGGSTPKGQLHAIASRLDAGGAAIRQAWVNLHKLGNGCRAPDSNFPRLDFTTHHKEDQFAVGRVHGLEDGVRRGEIHLPLLPEER